MNLVVDNRSVLSGTSFEGNLTVELRERDEGGVESIDDGDEDVDGDVVAGNGDDICTPLVCTPTVKSHV